MAKDSHMKLYAPSWVDRVTDWLRRLPGGSFAYYFGFGVFLFILQTVVSWLEGAPLIGPYSGIYLFFAVVIPYILVMIHILDDRAASAFDTMKPALTTDEDENKVLRYKLTVLPAFPTILAGLFAIGQTLVTEFISGAPYRLESLMAYPISDDFLRVIYFICWWFFGAFIYHTIRQLVVINRIYTQHTKINLFRMKPLYAFSNLTALTAGSLIVPPYGFLWVHPEVSISDPFILGFYVVITSVAVVTFIWPQLGIHRLQNAEKDRLLEEANQRFGLAVAELHRNVDDNHYEGMYNLNLALINIEKEMDTIKRTSTWPWQPETIRWLFTALVLPLGLWLLQFFLQRMLEG